eukprot:GHVS01094044.1.p1 GENE.GHVS01094044.1~~GHVS01094044.1.p1  ORF type:complete len:284 (+),score=104.69 GHVS01094044.1:385-1236(+)
MLSVCYASHQQQGIMTYKSSTHPLLLLHASYCYTSAVSVKTNDSCCSLDQSYCCSTTSVAPQQIHNNNNRVLLSSPRLLHHVRKYASPTIEMSEEEETMGTNKQENMEADKQTVKETREGGVENSKRFKQHDNNNSSSGGGGSCEYNNNSSSSSSSGGCVIPSGRKRVRTASRDVLEDTKQNDKKRKTSETHQKDGVVVSRGCRRTSYSCKEAMDDVDSAKKRKTTITTTDDELCSGSGGGGVRVLRQQQNNNHQDSISIPLWEAVLLSVLEHVQKVAQQQEL